MNHLTPEPVEQFPQTIVQEQSSNLTNTNEDDNTFVTNATLNDHQANIRRRAPTRHSIKSLTGRKSLSKQNSTKEYSSDIIEQRNIYFYVNKVFYQVCIDM
ncbi:unnamed protein product [Rotaria sp. Silwood1]|nr:unnamed protein product [Rotaria sp. Silwood1]